MPSIVNGLFAGRSGISSHGAAIAVVGDNISNASTIGFKASRAEFEDLVAGGQAAGRIVGSGSSLAAVNTIFEQGTLEFTSRALDLAIDGNGVFILDDNGQRFYTRAGNFKVDTEGFISSQDGSRVLGYSGTGATGQLDLLNVNAVSQEQVSTTRIAITGNLDASVPSMAAAAIPATVSAGDPPNIAVTTQYADLYAVAQHQTSVRVFDSLGASHNISFYFFKTNGSAREYTVRAYVNSQEVDPSGSQTGLPRQIGGNLTLTFNNDGSLTSTSATTLSATIPWNNGSDNTSSMDINFTGFTMFSAPSATSSVTQDGQGIGTVTNINIGKDGRVFALLSNGQSAIIGTIGLANFANPEALTRVGGNLLQQSINSGEPIFGQPQAGTLGSISAGSIELSTVDIANEFVKLITLQRGFQASSRIITTINQLLNEIIQLA